MRLVGMVFIAVLGCSGSKASAPSSPSPSVVEKPMVADPKPTPPAEDPAAKAAGAHMARAFTLLTETSLVRGDAKQLATVAWEALGFPAAELPEKDFASALRTRTQDGVTKKTIDLARVWAAITAMANAVDDGHVVLLDGAKMKQLGAAVGGQPFVIAGAIGHWTGNDFVISEVLDGSPAKTSGLAVGDVIVTIDGRAPRRASPIFMIAFQPPGTKLALRVRRAKGEVAVDLVLDNYLHPVGSHRVLKDGTGYIRLYFCGVGPDAKTNHIELTKAALKEMEAKKVKRVVLDMRGNMGGRSPAALASLFTPADAILFGRAREDTKDEPWPREGEVAWKKPVAVLIDDQTASCGEMIPYALQEHGAARLFGQPTVGALNVPKTEALDDDHALWIPIFEVFGPKSKKAPERYRAVPDEVVPNRSVADLLAGKDPQLAAALKWLAKQR